MYVRNIPSNSDIIRCLQRGLQPFRLAARHWRFWWKVKWCFRQLRRWKGHFKATTNEAGDFDFSPSVGISHHPTLFYLRSIVSTAQSIRPSLSSTLCPEKNMWPKCFFCNISNKNRPILVKVARYTVSRINLLQNHVNNFQLTWIICLYTTLWNLKCSSKTFYHWVITERNS